MGMENTAKPLTVEEAEELLPLPVAPELPANPSAYHERHEAVRALEQAESERATAAERRAALQQLRAQPAAGAVLEQPSGDDREVAAAELHAQSLHEMAAAPEEPAL